VWKLEVTWFNIVKTSTANMRFALRDSPKPLGRLLFELRISDEGCAA